MVRSVAQAAVVSVGWLTMAIPSLAASQQFPYSATVIADDVEVRCGPGSKFYVTGSLTKQDEVTVHRHDHGGWYMIAPPQGSFSWIEATLVEKSGDQGTVTIDLAEAPTGRATVYIGSQSGRDHSYFGRELTNGDQVQILGEEVLQMPQGATRMYKIVPPSQEFRWVKGEFLVPTDQTLQQRLAEDPYQIPPRHRQRLATLDLKPIGATEMEWRELA